jgi:hypothetical protein
MDGSTSITTAYPSRTHRNFCKTITRAVLKEPSQKKLDRPKSRTVHAWTQCSSHPPHSATPLQRPQACAPNLSPTPPLQPRRQPWPPLPPHRPAHLPLHHSRLIPSRGASCWASSAPPWNPKLSAARRRRERHGPGHVRNLLVFRFPVLALPLYPRALPQRRTLAVASPTAAVWPVIMGGLGRPSHRWPPRSPTLAWRSSIGRSTQATESQLLVSTSSYCALFSLLILLHHSCGTAHTIDLFSLMCYDMALRYAGRRTSPKSIWTEKKFFAELPEANHRLPQVCLWHHVHGCKW